MSKYLKVKVDDTTYKELKCIANDKGYPMAWIVRKLIKRYVLKVQERESVK